MSSYLIQKNDSGTSLINQGLEEDTTAKEQTKMRDAFGGKNAYESASCWSKLFFSWTAPVLDYSKKHQLNIDELGEVRSSHDVKIQQARLVTAWNYYKNSGSKYSLFKAVLRAFRWEFTVAVLWNFLIVALELISPFLLRWLIIYIRD